MMIRTSHLIWAFIVACCATVSMAYVASTLSYIDDIKLEYKDGIWQCDELTCPPETYGCRIIRRNDDDNIKLVIRINVCYDRDNTKIMAIRNVEELKMDRTVNINIDTHIGAKTQAHNGYNRALQNVVGTIGLEDWLDFQTQAREMIREVA